MKLLEIARVSMLRTLRNGRALFFVVIFPLILIVVLGMTYGGMGGGRVGVHDGDGGALARDLVQRLATSPAGMQLRTYATEAELRDAVERGFVEIGVDIPAGYDAQVRNGQAATLDYIAQPNSVASTVKTAVDAAIAGHVSAIRAARFAAERTDVGFAAAFSAAGVEQEIVAGVSVVVQPVSEAATYPNGFTLGAQSQLILFMFLTSLTGAVSLIVSRQLGISRREYATPTPARTIIFGEALGRYAFALFQGFIIVIGSWLLFGVDWSDPIATAALVLVFAAVSAGAAMLIGAVAANPSQAGAIGPAVGMLAALLGGAMVPPEVFPDVMRTLSHVTPHAWAIDAFREMSLHGGHLLQILPQLAALAGFAVVLLGLAVLRFRHVIVTGGI